MLLRLHQSRVLMFRISVLLRLAGLVCLIHSISAVEVSFPINSQVPPVAHVGCLFNFTFSPEAAARFQEALNRVLQPAP